MSLFFKIFLWFLLAMAIVVGVSIFVSWTTQNEPFAERLRNNSQTSIRIYTETAKQIYDNEGEAGIQKFFQIIRNAYPNREICLAAEANQNCFGENNSQLIQKAIQTTQPISERISPEENYIAQKFVTNDGKTFVMAMKIDFPRPPPPFGIDWRTRLLRIFAILLTAAIVCYGLTRYLVKPILSLRDATQKLAAGDFQTRIQTKRRDELGKLARDFDEMAERIELLLTSQTRLTRDISHELRSPLARMNVALELAKTKSTNDTQPLLERIERESNRLNDMISNILIISKLESKSETIEKKELNLSAIFESTVEDAKFEAAGKSKIVEMLKNDDIKIFGNERLLRSAIENVLRNAVRYTNDRVEVSLENHKDLAIIKIRDFGEGIPEEDLKEIFRPFYRVSEARERKSGGIGLGLAITEQAVNAHSGEVSAKNLSDGLLVEIKLPLSLSHQ